MLKYRIFLSPVTYFVLAERRIAVAHHMTYFQNHKKSILACLVIGFLVAMLTRDSLFSFSSDLEYYRFGPVYHPVPQIEFDKTNVGKEIIGMSGFPFRTYTKCIVSIRGTLPNPACEKTSIVWEFSIVLNTIFWGLLTFGILRLIRLIANPAQSIKS